MNNLPDKLYYKIGEIAKAFDVNTSLIRYWEKEFKVLKPQKNSQGKRRYTKKDVDIFKQIYFLVKEKGYTLEGAKQKLSKKTLPTQEATPRTLQVVLKLQQIKEELIAIKSALN
ncbi:MAG: transcriptional regulator [Flavobacteriia bacterium]|nr:MAG: transcriptional regulator [Flavobacteriia bacterium]